MRRELIDLEEVGMWNEWVRELRKKVLGGDLGGDRKELWREVGRNRVGLVDVDEVEGGSTEGVGGEEARMVSFFLNNFPPPYSFFSFFLPVFFLLFSLSFSLPRKKSPESKQKTNTSPPFLPSSLPSFLLTN